MAGVELWKRIPKWEVPEIKPYRAPRVKIKRKLPKYACEVCMLKASIRIAEIKAPIPWEPTVEVPIKPTAKYVWEKYGIRIFPREVRKEEIEKRIEEWRKSYKVAKRGSLTMENLMVCKFHYVPEVYWRVNPVSRLICVRCPQAWSIAKVLIEEHWEQIPADVAEKTSVRVMYDREKKEWLALVPEIRTFDLFCTAAERFYKLRLKPDEARALAEKKRRAKIFAPNILWLCLKCEFLDRVELFNHPSMKFKTCEGLEYWRGDALLLLAEGKLEKWWK